MLAALAERRPIEESVAIVVAHQDDETIAAGGSMHLMRRLLLVHVTDGAPRRLGDAAREGFATPLAYADARERELDMALGLSGASPTRVLLGFADQDATRFIGEIAKRLERLFRRHEVVHVLTHAYEGGHPDHDAVAVAVHRVAGQVHEFAGYHAGPDGTLVSGQFLGPGGLTVTLPKADQERKRAMLDCFRTQAEILSHFDSEHEFFRVAPNYDFSEPPHSGALLYENWGWMTGKEWRQCAA